MWSMFTYGVNILHTLLTGIYKPADPGAAFIYFGAG